MVPGFAQAHIKRTAAAMSWMCRLKTHRMQPETFFMQPKRHFTPEAAFAFWCVKMRRAMQRVAGKGRGSFTGDHKHEAVALVALAREKMQKLDAGCFKALAMEIKPGLRFYLTPPQPLSRAPVHLGKGWWTIVDNPWPYHW
jgi:hypothetical protein